MYITKRLWYHQWYQISGITMLRRCCFRQCEGKFPLYGLPKVSTIPQQYSPTLRFTEDCFLNWAHFTTGFTTCLVLKDIMFKANKEDTSEC